MPAATLTAKGEVVIPAEIRARYGLLPGTQIEFVDDGGSIRLVVRRRVNRWEAMDGYGLVRLKSKGKPRLLSECDAVTMIKKSARS